MRRFFTLRVFFLALSGLFLLQMAFNIAVVWSCRHRFMQPGSLDRLSATIEGTWSTLPPDPRPERVTIRYREFSFVIPVPAASVSSHQKGLIAWMTASTALMLVQPPGDSDCQLTAGLRSRARASKIPEGLLAGMGLPPGANDFDMYKLIYQATPNDLAYLSWIGSTAQTAAFLTLKEILTTAHGPESRIFEWHGNGLDALVFLGSRTPRLLVYDRAHHRSFEALFIQEGPNFWNDHDLAAVLRSLQVTSPEERKTQRSDLLQAGRTAFRSGDLPAATLAYAQFHANFPEAIDLEAHRNTLEALGQLRPKSREAALHDLKRRLASDTAAFEALAAGR